MQNNIETMRHSCAHLVAAAVLELYPEAKFGVGPVVENGFYYDIDFPKAITEEDLGIIEAKAKSMAKENISFKKESVSIDEAIKIFTDLGQIYKVELLNDIKTKGTTKLGEMDVVAVDNDQVTMYRTGQFVDLCRGPHVSSTGEVGVFQLTKLAGAYWRGDDKNKMLTRIYGLAFATQAELDDFIIKMEEAAKRDHRKLGKELDLFCFSDLVGPGLPLFTPKGVVIIDELKKHIENVCRGYGFEKVMTPHLAKIKLYEISGHAQKFSEELFHVHSERDHQFVMKPVQCPHQTQIYASRPRSYRDLPIRYMESERQYRAEKTGEVSGLNRVYAITVEDGHTFCRVDQVKAEIINMVNIIKDFYSAMGLWGNHWVSLSVRDYQHQEKYIGDVADWDLCEQILQEVSDEMGLEAKKCEGEAALYGPKLDFMFKDSLGKEIQIPTVQIDFATPKRFELTYINEKGEHENPVMVHRAVLGSYERFLVLLIEHFGGNFPVWLSPVQVRFVSVSEKHSTGAIALKDELIKLGVRADVDISDETLGNKVRKAVAEKIPYLIAVGDKELNGEDWLVRIRGKEKQEKMTKEDFINQVLNDIKDRKL